jgi:hypothetical protein
MKNVDMTQYSRMASSIQGSGKPLGGKMGQRGRKLRLGAGRVGWAGARSRRAGRRGAERRARCGPLPLRPPPPLPQAPHAPWLARARPGEARAVGVHCDGTARVGRQDGGVRGHHDLFVGGCGGGGVGGAGAGRGGGRGLWGRGGGRAEGPAVCRARAGGGGRLRAASASASAHAPGSACAPAPAIVTSAGMPATRNLLRGVRGWG